MTEEEDIQNTIRLLKSNNPKIRSQILYPYEIWDEYLGWQASFIEMRDLLKVANERIANTASTEFETRYPAIY